MTPKPAATPADQAQRLAAGAALSELPPDIDPLALAWALKDLCYAAWHGEPARAAQAADALRAISEQGVAPQAAGVVAALADWTAGIACVTRGGVAQAPALFDRAATGLRAAGLPGPAAETQVPKIMALSMLGRPDDAVACALAAQRELLSLGNVAAAARVSQNLGSLQLFRDRYAEAAAHFRQAAVLFARQRDHGYSVLADIGLAGALLALGDFDEAGRIYARAAMRAANKGLALQQALADDGLGLLHLARGGWRQALTAFESARRRYETLALPQYRAVAERQLADVYLELRLLPEALAMAEAAVATFHGLNLAVEEAWALKQRGLALALLGQAGADDSLAAAATLFATQGNGYGQATVALARAELALLQGDAAAAAHAAAAAQGFSAAGQASAQLRAEVVCAEASLAAGEAASARAAFGTTLAAARALQVAAVEVRCLSGLGEVALAGGDTAAATAEFEAAIELFENQRAALPDDALRSAFLGGHLRPYQARLHMALATGDAVAVLVQLDRCRARALDERQAEGTDRAADDDGLRAVRERVNWLQRRVQRLQDEGGAWQALDEERRQREHELLERARRRRLGSEPGAGVAPVAALDVAALQAALLPGDAVVAYGADGQRCFACVVTRAGVAMCELPGRWSDVSDAVLAFRFQADALRHGSAALQRHMGTLQARAEARLRAIHALVWAPLAGLLGATRRVVIVPHGVLAEVPFAALSAGAGPLFSPLCDSLAVSLAPSVRAAHRDLARQPAKPRCVRAFGESQRLPHAATEASFVAGLFAGGQAFVGSAATLPALQAQAQGADVLHLACHAEFRSDNPRFSALHLADAPLTVDLAEALPLAGSTVVLSACETGRAEASAGDEHLGLVRGFLVAGAARVLASLWPVDDAVTAAFMGCFYRALAAGSSTSDALRQAMQTTRLTHPHPCFWGAFTLHGGW